MSRSSLMSFLVVGALWLASACGGKTPPAISPTTPPPRPQAFPGGGSPPSSRPPVPPAPDAPPILAAELPVVSADPLATMDTDEINRQAPLGPVLFGYDSDSVDAEGQKVLTDNAAILKKYPTWAITIEGHSDERGTAEYNLALGERRALATKSYLLSLGISADRIRTVSYGKEFPFDPGHDEAAYAKNRRGHFVVTAK